MSSAPPPADDHDPDEADDASSLPKPYDGGGRDPADPRWRDETRTAPPPSPSPDPESPVCEGCATETAVTAVHDRGENEDDLRAYCDTCAARRLGRGGREYGLAVWEAMADQSASAGTTTPIAMSSYTGRDGIYHVAKPTQRARANGVDPDAFIRAVDTATTTWTYDVLDHC